MKVEYLRHSGTDLDVVNAAKVSFSKESQWEYDTIMVPGFAEAIYPQHINPHLSQKDINLINYLARGTSTVEWENIVHDLIGAKDETFVREIVDDLIHKAVHWVPFSHNSITLRMAAPIPIRVHCFKHKIGFTESEESRRYISSTPELHIPEEFHTRPANVKQGSSDYVHGSSELYRREYKKICSKAIDLYEEMVNANVAPEEARYVLPQGVIVNWIWTGNLASYARYYNQRSDSHAQKDSQILAEEVRKIIEPLFPVSWAALTRRK